VGFAEHEDVAASAVEGGGGEGRADPTLATSAHYPLHTQVCAHAPAQPTHTQPPDNTDIGERMYCTVRHHYFSGEVCAVPIRFLSLASPIRLMSALPSSFLRIYIYIYIYICVYVYMPVI
jgi:hypothetical protein